MCRDSDNIVRCIEAFYFKDRFWVFLEHMDGGELTPMIEELAGAYGENFCRFTCRKVLLTLSYLHEKHIIHRDIKSDNFLVSERGEVKLADFGYATPLTLKRETAAR